MWTRALLKDNAKRALRATYWRAFLVCLVMTLLGTTNSGVNARNTYTAAQGTMGSIGSEEVWTGNVPAPNPEAMLSTVPAAIWGLLGVSVMIGLLLGLAWTIFLANPLNVGMNRYFMENRQSPTPFGTVWTVFRTPYLNVVKVQLLVHLKIALGTLLFIIPGIYWSYCYKLVPYLLAEDPYMTTSRAMELSRQMMEGEKFSTWVLELSFTGWYLLGSLLLGLGVLFVNPYYEATLAELYAALRSKAFEFGMTDSNELGGFVRHDPNP